MEHGCTIVLDNKGTIVHLWRMTETILNETLRLIRESDIPLTIICRDVEVKPRWLHRLLAGDYADPGVNKIERLNRYLKSKNTEVAA